MSQQVDELPGIIGPSSSDGLGQPEVTEMHISEKTVLCVGNDGELTNEELEFASGGLSDLMRAVVAGLTRACFEGYGGAGPGAVCTKFSGMLM